MTSVKPGNLLKAYSLDRVVNAQWCTPDLKSGLSRGKVKREFLFHTNGKVPAAQVYQVKCLFSIDLG